MRLVLKWSTPLQTSVVLAGAHGCFRKVPVGRQRTKKVLSAPHHMSWLGTFRMYRNLALFRTNETALQLVKDIGAGRGRDSAELLSQPL
ncbi:hypothetical protein CBR_g9072 [Chara braunii]|uniref:Uncharacterized protein n=1 Tax=Chara braunii TaxID=69332 RepID=A0A388KNP7_CHABU|nr:hypothetical protein CBR_g9072 [Chara braunii]|eukprot:GBG71657.1 hypothetical protein CBR_g9072 [Chara braunii]